MCRDFTTLNNFNSHARPVHLLLHGFSSASWVLRLSVEEQLNLHVLNVSHLHSYNAASLQFMT